MSGKLQSIFGELMRVGCQQARGTDYLEQCMSFDPHLDKKVPLRYRLIALGFIKHYTLDELNAKLMENNCERLYARNIWEAGLLYAFAQEMTFEGWKLIEAETRKVMEQQSLGSSYFQENVITVAELKRYVDENSDTDAQILRTRHQTRMLSEKIRGAASAGESFAEFLLQNVSEFSQCREKARYYFCKYLLYFLQAKITGFVTDMKNGMPRESENYRDGMNVFKGIATQRRKKNSPEEMQKFLENTGISCGEIFDGFNEFYCGYVTIDWMETLLEYYGDIRKLPEDDRVFLAESLRHYHKEFSALSDTEVIAREVEILQRREQELDEAYSLDSTGRGYQRGRQGENTIRKYIRGELDIDRVSLIFYILYFGFTGEIPKEYQITRERLSDILQECGYARLREKDDFDSFIIQYLVAEDPVAFLIDEVTCYAFNEENFFLYKQYQASRNENEVFQKLIGEAPEKNPHNKKPHKNK